MLRNLWDEAQSPYRKVATVRIHKSDRTQYQSVDSFLIDENLHQNPEDKKDRTFKLSYPENKPLTFYFMALPPGRDPTDTESWIMPTWLAFAFPIILDVKIDYQLLSSTD